MLWLLLPAISQNNIEKSWNLYQKPNKDFYFFVLEAPADQYLNTAMRYLH